jgi:hypothetical protein
MGALPSLEVIHVDLPVKSYLINKFNSMLAAPLFLC